MKKLYIEINGQQWPCRPTCGAMLRFHEETGREITEINGNSATDICTYIWCCVKSASDVEGKPFDMSLMEFADRIDQSDLITWAKLLGEQNENDGKAGKKKRPSGS